MVDKQKLETNHCHQMYENCHISASKVPRYLKFAERGRTIMYHKMDLLVRRTNYVSNYMA